jgi:hypothetical protein
MQAGRTGRLTRAAARGFPVAALGVATLHDGVAFLLGTGTPPSAGAAFSWAAVVAAILAGCMRVLVRVMRRPPWRTAAARALRRVTVLELTAIGIALGALRLRGHHEIPPDPPLLVAQAVALVLLCSALVLWRGSRP